MICANKEESTRGLPNSICIAFVLYSMKSCNHSTIIPPCYAVRMLLKNPDSLQCLLCYEFTLFFQRPLPDSASSAICFIRSASLFSASCRCCSSCCSSGKSEFQNPGGTGSLSQTARCLETCCTSEFLREL